MDVGVGGAAFYYAAAVGCVWLKGPLFSAARFFCLSGWFVRYRFFYGLAGQGAGFRLRARYFSPGDPL